MLPDWLRSRLGDVIRENLFRRLCASISWRVDFRKENWNAAEWKQLPMLRRGPCLVLRVIFWGILYLRENMKKYEGNAVQLMIGHNREYSPGWPRWKWPSAYYPPSPSLPCPSTRNPPHKSVEESQDGSGRELIIQASAPTPLPHLKHNPSIDTNTKWQGAYYATTSPSLYDTKLTNNPKHRPTSLGRTRWMWLWAISAQY